MSDQTKFIHLSAESIHEILDLCQLIEERNATNEISTKMAQGISAYAAANGFVTPKQAQWLARNADYYRKARPQELDEIEVRQQSDKGKDGSVLFRNSSVSDEVLTALASIRDNLDKVIDKLNA